jgi:ATP-dependent DNA helicase RecQ
MADEVLDVLTAVFGHTQFRPLQREAIEAFLDGRDVSLILPTGGGKSLCFQVPAVLLARAGKGPTLIVSPLVALMEDQVRALALRSVRAVAFHAGVPWAEQRAALMDLASLTLVYASPERLQNQGFRRALAAARLARAVVDEAHCISEWGHDFRPEYRSLSFLKRELCLPVMAVTATATSAVVKDIAESLTLAAPLSLRAPMQRPNLSFAVHFAERERTRTAWVGELLRERGFQGRKAPGHALVYTATRKRAQEVQRALRKAGIAAGYYHAGRNDSARARAQVAFELGKTPVLVATSAYGMGVDIPGVRIVVHTEAPSSLEAYVQQAGRAGRDGLKAECLLGFSEADALIHARITRGRSSESKASFAALSAYATADECRQRVIARHFSDREPDPCGECDVCKSPEHVRERRANAESQAKAKRKVSSEAELVTLSEGELAQVVAFVDALKKPLGRRVIVKGLRGSRARDVLKRRLTENRHFGALRACSEESLFAALDGLLERGLLVRKGKKYPTLWVAGKAVRSAPARTGQPRRDRPRGLSTTLKDYRRKEARRRRLKPYQVFQNRTLEALCSARPQTEAQLLEIWGLGEERVRKYGSDLLSLLAQA